MDTNFLTAICIKRYLIKVILKLPRGSRIISLISRRIVLRVLRGSSLVVLEQVVRAEAARRRVIRRVARETRLLAIGDRVSRHARKYMILGSFFFVPRIAA